MKCVIFGGGGFIGSAISDRLLSEGHELRIFERPRVQKYRHFSINEHVEWVTGDLLNTHDVDNAIDGADVVLHLISTTLPKSSNDDPIYDVQSNLIATLHLLNSMVIKDIKRIIFISSGGTIYGIPRYLPIDEKHPTDPLVSYGVIKLAIEKYLLMYEHLHGMNATILRVANPFGERQRFETDQGAVGVFLHKAINNESIEIWGDGSIKRDYLYVGDVAEAFANAINYSGNSRIFNISSGCGTSLNELLKVLEEVLGLPINRNYLPGRPFDVPTSILCNKLANQNLGWYPKVSLKEGISRTVEWMMNAN